MRYFATARKNTMSLFLAYVCFSPFFLSPFICSRCVIGRWKQPSTEHVLVFADCPGRSALAWEGAVAIVTKVAHMSVSPSFLRVYAVARRNGNR